MDWLKSQCPEEKGQSRSPAASAAELAKVNGDKRTKKMHNDANLYPGPTSNVGPKLFYAISTATGSILATTLMILFSTIPSITFSTSL